LRSTDKVIILLTAGVKSSSESLEDIRQTITAGKQLAGEVTIVTFGLKTG